LADLYGHVSAGTYQHVDIARTGKGGPSTLFRVLVLLRECKCGQGKDNDESAGIFRFSFFAAQFRVRIRIQGFGRRLWLLFGNLVRVGNSSRKGFVPAR